MASIYSTTATCPSSNYPGASSNGKTCRNFFSKPPHFLTCVSKTGPRTFQVSCNAENENANDEACQGKLDRRNMLFGLGGLYGASNLVSNSPALARPLKAPEFKKCGAATFKAPGDSTRTLEVEDSCCPPIPCTNEIIEYELPAVKDTEMKIRPPAHSVTRDYILKYNKAIDLMKNLPRDDPRNFMQQANIHCAYCNGAHDQPGHKPAIDIQVHECWLFFPFHRWYLYFFERILGYLIDDPTFALPFWNWDHPDGMSVPNMFSNPELAIYDENRDPEIYKKGNILDLSFSQVEDHDQLVTNNLTAIYNEMYRSVDSLEDFMGQDYHDGCAPNPGGGSSENGSHTAVHYWVGTKKNNNEDMGNFYSAGRDPLFYCHHANVDRMWTLFKNEVKHEHIPMDFTDKDFLDSAFLFYDENKRLCRVKVRDCLDNEKMGYKYKKVDLPWIDYRPPPQAPDAKVFRISKSTTAKDPALVFPVRLKNAILVKVRKSEMGKANESLQLENITVDPTRPVKFDVYVNDEDDDLSKINKAAFAGTFFHVPRRTRDTTNTTGSIKMNLTKLYEDMPGIDEDFTVVVRIVPRINGEYITIGNIKIVANPPRK